jgi:prefoldin subunit 5
METLKNNQSKINNSLFQINITIKSLANRMEQLKIEYQELKIE